MPNTVLKQSLVEGGAELLAELTSGEASESYLQRWTKGREREIGKAFLADVASTDLKRWLYNGVGTPEKPGDLGYWVGYCIAKSYFTQAKDKRVAIKMLLELRDPKKLLADSGWKPGDSFAGRTVRAFPAPHDSRQRHILLTGAPCRAPCILSIELPRSAKTVR